MAIETIQPDIFILGLRIQEPVTTVTDIILAIANLYGFYRIKNSGKNGNTHRFLKHYFLLMAIATAIGGIIGHAFFYIFGMTWRIPGWFLSMIAIMFIERSSIEHANNLVSSKVGKIFLRVNIWELVILMAITAYTLDFFFVELHGAYGILGFVFSFQIFIYRKTRDVGSKYMIWGVIILIIATFIFNYPIIIDKWFTHADFAHVLMTITTFLFIKAGLNFGNTPDTTPAETN